MIRNLLITVLLIVLIGGVWYKFFRSPAETTTTLVGGAVTDTDIQAKNVLNRINLVNQINISLNIFDNPSFKRLVDHSEIITIPPELFNRENPFADINVTSVPTQRAATDSANQTEG